MNKNQSIMKLSNNNLLSTNNFKMKAKKNKFLI